ncbi:MAG: hypothetical protein EPN84_09445 [Legionella sp.]|nr:MAG: hypothetical protein EPN84_09445 [Legionella sp.]
MIHPMQSSYYFSKTVSLIFLHCLLFALLAWLLLPNLDIDMYENFAWAQKFAWGSFKHPTFFAWVTGLWFHLFPVNHGSYFLLSYANAGLGLWGILALAQLLLHQVPGQGKHPEQERVFLLLVLGFAVLALPYNLYAAVFNADSILISLWPWTTYVFFAIIFAKDTRKKWFWTFALSSLAAAAILGKYFSFSLLVSLVILSLWVKEYRSLYLKPYPYVVLACGLMLLWPHLRWEYQMNFPCKTYYAHYLNTDPWVLFKHGLTFSLTGIYFFAFSWIAWLVLKQMSRNTVRSASLRKISNHLLASLFLLPWFISLLLSVLGGISIKDRWAIPLWFALPIYMANQLIPWLPSLQTKMKLLWRFWGAFVALVCIALLFTLTISNHYLSAHQDYLEARKEMVTRIADQFHQQFPNEELSWVGGNVWPDHIAPLAFYLPNHPRAIPGFPDRMPAMVSPHTTWKKEIGVIVCGKKYADSAVVIENCVQETREWLLGLGLSVREQDILYNAQGWRWTFLPPPEKKVTVFWVRA